MNHFPFVTDQILQTNLNITFDHIVDLLALSLSPEYKSKRALVSSLRKTIIIHTASTIEALLLWKLKSTCDQKCVKLDEDWKYLDIKVIYQIDDGHEVISGLRKKEERSIDKLDFLRVTDLCVRLKILKQKKLRENIDKVRALRNRLHIGGLQEIEKEYKKSDLEFCFKTAKKIKDILRK